jgi:hypothetical protein
MHIRIKKNILGNIDTLVAYMYMHACMHACMCVCVHAREYKFTFQIQIYLPQNKKKNATLAMARMMPKREAK